MEILGHFEQEDNSYKLKNIGYFLNNNYTEYESNGVVNKSLFLKEYLDKIKLYLNDIIDLQESDTWKSQLVS